MPLEGAFLKYENGVSAKWEGRMEGLYGASNEPFEFFFELRHSKSYTHKAFPEKILADTGTILKMCLDKIPFPPPSPLQQKQQGSKFHHHTSLFLV